VGNNATTMRRLYDAFGKGDVPSVLAAMDPQIRWEEPEGIAPLFTDQTGPDAVMQNIFAALPTLFQEFSVNVDEIHDAGDVVLSVGIYRGVGKETGRTLAAHFAHVWRFGADGKITGFRTYTDTHLWREALGANAPASSSP
jgi:ketosteroid isomerase-like protein